MIVPIKKYSFLVYHAIYIDFLENLREIGVVDVIEKQLGHVEEHSELYEKLEERKRINDLLKLLKQRFPEGLDQASVDTKANREDLLRRFEGILNEQTQLKPKSRFKP